MNDRQASICAGDRGGKVLICDGHRYHKRGENGDTAHKINVHNEFFFYIKKDKKGKRKKKGPWQ